MGREGETEEKKERKGGGIGEGEGSERGFSSKNSGVFR